MTADELTTRFMHARLSAASAMSARPVDPSDQRGIAIPSAEGVTSFSGFSEDRNPNPGAEKRIEAKLLAIAQANPEHSSAYLAKLQSLGRI